MTHRVKKGPHMAMTLKQIDKRITEMENEYGWANTWPLSYQQECDKLCEAKENILRKQKKRRESPECSNA